MSIINLDKLLNPSSVALIGASDQAGTVGYVVMENLLDGDFSGPIMPVNPKYPSVQGVIAYENIWELPRVPDLAVICTPAETIPGIIQELGKLGCRSGIIISDGYHDHEADTKLKQAILNAAKPHNFRILGPNCAGLLISKLGLNASFAHTNAINGKLALISQSGALCTTILDWANSRGIGFSHFISIGESMDVDFGDLLDYLSSDRNTKGILLYVESIKDSNKFMSAARAASRNKPVIIIKAGAAIEIEDATTSHSGAMISNDEVFDAAIRRAGMLRVDTIRDLFHAVETLAHVDKVQGNRLAIMANGSGADIIATDDLVRNGGRLAELSPETIERLDNVLPDNWPRSNPVDIIGDADAKRYVESLKIMLDDPNYDAVLVMLVPNALINNKDVAEKLVDVIKEAKKPVLTCWMGEDSVAEANEVFEQANVAHYDTPSSAVRAFLQLHEFYQNQLSLMETPASIPESFKPDVDQVNHILNKALDNGRSTLNESESKKILANYDIPVVETLVAKSIDEAVLAAEEIQYPVALKILSDDITHKSDVGGVELNIDCESTLRAVAESMLAKVRRYYPNTEIDGFTVQKMIAWEHAHELIIGSANDAVFGPVILFGEGGTSVEVVQDRAVSLPPLNMKLARELIERTRISKLLRGYRDIPAVNIEAIQLTLVKISQLIVDHPEIVELDINPLFVDSGGVIAVDARIKIKKRNEQNKHHLAISPYPKELENNIALNSGEQILVRPIKPEDEHSHHDFISKVDTQDLYYRFMYFIREIDHENLARFTQIDYEREMAFVVKQIVDGKESETIGVVRAIFDADGINAEFAILVRSDFHRKGLGKIMMQKMIDYCRAKGTQHLIGQSMDSNLSMRRLANDFGFEINNLGQDNLIELNLSLQPDSITQNFG